MTYKQIGGLYFFTLGPFGFTFYIKRRKGRWLRSSLSVFRKGERNASI